MSKVANMADNIKILVDIYAKLSDIYPPSSSKHNKVDNLIKDQLDEISIIIQKEGTK